MNVSGVYVDSILIEHGNLLGNIQFLKPYWDNDYTVVNQNNKTQVYSSVTPVDCDISIFITKNTRVIVKIDPIDDINTTDVINAITDIIGVDPGHVTIDVVRDDDGKVTEITIIVHEKIAADVVDNINSIDTGSNCDAGVFCRRREAYIEVGPQSMSTTQFLWFPTLTFLLITFVNLT